MGEIYRNNLTSDTSRREPLIESNSEKREPKDLKYILERISLLNKYKSSLSRYVLNAKRATVTALISSLLFMNGCETRSPKQVDIQESSMTEVRADYPMPNSLEGGKLIRRKSALELTRDSCCNFNYVISRDDRNSFIEYSSHQRELSLPDLAQVAAHDFLITLPEEGGYKAVASLDLLDARDDSDYRQIFNQDAPIKTEGYGGIRYWLRPLKGTLEVAFQGKDNQIRLSEYIEGSHDLSEAEVIAIGYELARVLAEKEQRSAQRGVIKLTKNDQGEYIVRVTGHDIKDAIRLFQGAIEEPKNNVLTPFGIGFVKIKK